MFNNLRTSTGLNSTRLADIRHKGYFTCDQDGLYWISISLIVHTASSRVDLYKNSNVLNYIYLNYVSYHDMTTFASLERLSVGDTIIAKAGTTVEIHGRYNSVLSVFQLTTWFSSKILFNTIQMFDYLFCSCYFPLYIDVYQGKDSIPVLQNHSILYGFNVDKKKSYN